MEFRRSLEDGGVSMPPSLGYNPPPIRASAFSKPLLPPTSTLLSPRPNGIGLSTTTPSSSDAFNPTHPSPDPPIIPDPVAADGLNTTTAQTTLTASSTSAITITKESSPPADTPAAKYRECLRNHAASLGGLVLDGCGEFMSGGSGSDSLKCAACGCHRSFHRKEIEGGEHNHCYSRFNNGAGRGRIPLMLPPPPQYNHLLSPSPSGVALPGAAAFNYSGSCGATTESSSEDHPGALRPPMVTPGVESRKRFRSKFTPEQKKRMLGFAESVGWRMQKQDEAVVEQFCAEVGIRRQILKVWMHNNKHIIRKQQQEEKQQQQEQQQQNQQVQQQHRHQEMQH